VGIRLLRFRAWLREVLELVRPVLVAYEQPVIHRERRQLNVAVGHNLEGVLLAELEGQIDYVSPLPSQVKKHATGRGNCSKPAMVAAAEQRWGRRPATHDEADALCLLAWAFEVVGEAR
jgi:Holliday junction resolvasome RuvABC endonuclease subunit